MEIATWRARAYRWRRWLIALAVLVLLRAALPEVLRRVIVSQASEALHAQVDVGDVDLRLWRGGFALETSRCGLARASRPLRLGPRASRPLRPTAPRRMPRHRWAGRPRAQACSPHLAPTRR